ncbi:MAG TPA: hypothetical protein VGG42_06800 [Acidobacteriaceae bacterium]|jgi:hypothetical protein
MKAIATVVAVFTLSLLPVAGRAQTPAESTPPPPQHFYRLHFAVEELDATGKLTNTRSYEETIATGNAADQQIKTGSRIPIATGSYGSSGVQSSLMNTQFQYIDLGVNLDVRNVTEYSDKLGFRLKAEISSVARQTEIAGIGEPVIRQNSWDSTLTVPVGKPTVVYSSDDLDSKGRMQVEVTATRVE